MSTTDRQSGDVVDVIAPTGGVVSGKLFAFGAAELPLLPITTAAQGELVACYTRQTVEVETDGSGAITAGARLAPDANGQVLASATGSLIALTDAAAQAGDKLMVLMTGVAGAAVV